MPRPMQAIVKIPKTHPNMSQDVSEAASFASFKRASEIFLMSDPTFSTKVKTIFLHGGNSNLIGSHPGLMQSARKKNRINLLMFENDAFKPFPEHSDQNQNKNLN